MSTSAQKSSVFHPFVSDEIKKAVYARRLNIDHYLQELLFARVGQTMDPNNHIRDIYVAHSLIFVRFLEVFLLTILEQSSRRPIRNGDMRRRVKVTVCALTFAKAPPSPVCYLRIKKHIFTVAMSTKKSIRNWTSCRRAAYQENLVSSPIAPPAAHLCCRNSRLQEQLHPPGGTNIADAINDNDCMWKQLRQASQEGRRQLSCQLEKYLKTWHKDLVKRVEIRQELCTVLGRKCIYKYSSNIK